MNRIFANLLVFFNPFLFVAFVIAGALLMVAQAQQPPCCLETLADVQMHYAIGGALLGAITAIFTCGFIALLVEIRAELHELNHRQSSGMEEG